MTTIDRPFGRYFEDFEVGDVYKHWPGKTITEYDDHLFCMITMNHHPMHTNEWFAEHETVHGQERRGRQPRVLARARHERARRERCRHRQPRGRVAQHKKPTFHGDTIYAETRVLDEGVVVEGRPRRRHGRDQGLQPARRGGLLLPPQGDGVEAGARRRPAGGPTTARTSGASRAIDPTGGRGASALDGRRALRAGPPVLPGRGRSTPRRASWASVPGPRCCDLAAGTGKFTRLLVPPRRRRRRRRARRGDARPAGRGAARRSRRSTGRPRPMPAARRARSTRSPWPRRSTGSTRRGAGRDRPGAAARRRAGAGVERARRVRALGAPSSAGSSTGTTRPARTSRHRLGRGGGRRRVTTRRCAPRTFACDQRDRRVSCSPTGCASISYIAAMDRTPQQAHVDRRAGPSSPASRRLRAAVH